MVTASTAIYTLSLHDALPICAGSFVQSSNGVAVWWPAVAMCVLALLAVPRRWYGWAVRSEEHTSELQSRFDLVCRLLLEKKNKEQICRSIDKVRLLGAAK